MTEFTDLLKQFESDQEAPPPDKPKIPILVVDDDPSIRRGLSRVFTHKYEVLTAECGRNAVETLSDAVHCVILDVKMKELNGFATYPKLKAKSPNVPIIFYTAFQSEHDLQDVINKFKPEGYVDKGQNITFLDNLVGNAVTKYQLIIENEGYRQDLEKKVEARTKELSDALQELKLTQSHLVQSEKMASLGTLAAGIAHEINNGITSIDRSVDQLNSYFIQYKTIKDEIWSRVGDSDKTNIEGIANQVFQFALNSLPPDTSHVRNKAKEVQTKLKQQRVMIERQVAKNIILCGFDLHNLEALIPFFQSSESDLILKYLDVHYKLGNTLQNVSIGKERIKEIVAAIRDYSHINRGETCEIDINDGIDKTLFLMTNLTKYGIKIEKNYDAQLPKPIGHPGEINQVWTNAIKNAVDAMHGNGTLTIKTFVLEDGDKSYVGVKICDTGHGIQKDVKAKIFDPFFTTKDVGRGSGLGLSVSKNIIEKHNGKVSVYSEKGKVTVFECLLPIEK